MTIAHHLTDETLLRFAAGTLPAGLALVASAHLEGCPACRARLLACEAIGGALLDALPPERMEPDALARLMARIDGDDAPPPVAAPRRMPDFPGDIRLPEALRACDVSPWKWLGPGVRLSHVSIPGGGDSGAVLLRIGAGRRLPEHGHGALELTQVLYGAFSDRFGRYGPGDVSETDEDVDHQPVVDRDGECVCLAALEGGMLFKGLLGRLMQPFVRF